MSKLTPLERALRQFDDKQTRLADAIGTSQQNISNWLRANRPLPAEYVLRAEEATGISRHDWRPDIYPRPTGQVESPHPFQPQPQGADLPAQPQPNPAREKPVARFPDTSASSSTKSPTRSNGSGGASGESERAGAARAA